MAREEAPDQDFGFEPVELAESEGALRLVVDLDGYEGPLDLMLDLARREKLDLRTIPILALAEQYLAFIREAQRLKLELAGDYLVMAAWLTYLKSRLLLPGRPQEAGPDAEELAQDLAARLQRLEAVRRAGAWFAERLAAQLETLPRGMIEPVIVEQRPAWDVSVIELAQAYAERRIAAAKARYRIATRRTLSIPEARAILERLVGRAAEWCPIEVLIAAIRPTGAEPRSARASAFVAALELAREGRLELKQDALFAPLFVRAGLRPETAAQTAEEGA